MPTDDLAPLRDTLRALTRMMRGEALTLADLHKPGGPSRPTLRRRLHALADELRYVRRSNKGAGKTERFSWQWPSEQQATQEQVWALALSRAFLDSFAQTELGRVLRDLTEDFATRVGDVPPADLSRLYYASAQLLIDKPPEPDAVDAVAQAIYQRRVVSFDYTKFEGDSYRIDLEPWTLLIAHDGLYVYGKCVGCQDNHSRVGFERMYAFARMTAVKTSKKGFTYPERSVYDPERLLKHCWGLMLPEPLDRPPATVVLDFAPEWRSYLHHKTLHSSQAPAETQADGWHRVRMSLHITYDLVRWVRGHGRSVRVVEPPGLANWIASGEGASGRATYAQRAAP